MLLKFLSRKFLSTFVYMLLTILFKNFGFQISEKELFIFGALVGFYIFMEGLKDIKNAGKNATK